MCRKRNSSWFAHFIEGERTFTELSFPTYLPTVRFLQQFLLITGTLTSSSWCQWRHLPPLFKRILASNRIGILHEETKVLVLVIVIVIVAGMREGPIVAIFPLLVMLWLSSFISFYLLFLSSSFVFLVTLFIFSSCLCVKITREVSSWTHTHTEFPSALLVFIPLKTRTATTTTSEDIHPEISF